MFYYNRRYLLELAHKKQDIKLRLWDQSEYVITHLLCIYFWPNLEYVSHWISEVYSGIPTVPKMKHNNKYPSSKDIYESTFGGVEDTFVYQFDTYKDIVLSKEDKLEEPENLNPNKIHDYLNDYFHWLSNELSKNGKVTKVHIEDKIHELLSKYH